jgi:hypothetical protein
LSDELAVLERLSRIGDARDKISPSFYPTNGKQPASVFIANASSRAWFPCCYAQRERSGASVADRKWLDLCATSGAKVYESRCTRVAASFGGRMKND